MQLDVALRRAWRRIKDALPGPTTASRLMRRPGGWRNAPPQQRAAAFAQHMHTQQQLHQLHVGQKLAPKIIDLLFKGLCGHLQAPLGQIILLILLAMLFGLF